MGIQVLPTARIIFLICLFIHDNEACPKKANDFFNKLLGRDEEALNCPNIQKSSTYDGYAKDHKNCGYISIKPSNATNGTLSSLTTTAAPLVPVDPTTLIDHFPWEARIHIKGSPELYHGALINQKFVLTAAHAVVTEDGALKPILCVRLGYNPREFKGSKSVCAHVAEVIPHPNYDPSSGQNDVALLKLSISVWFTSFISPICLPNDELYPSVTLEPGTKLKVTGSDSSKKLGTSDNERLISVKSIEFEKCKKKWISANTPSNISEILQPAQYVCGSWPGKTHCQGDGGKPLLFEIKESDTKFRYIHVGIKALFSPDCDNDPKPPVYMKTQAYMLWIGQKTDLKKPKASKPQPQQND